MAYDLFRLGRYVFMFLKKWLLKNTTCYAVPMEVTSITSEKSRDGDSSLPTIGSSDARRDMEMIAIWFHSELQDSEQMDLTRFSAVVDVRVRHHISKGSGLKAMCRGTVPGKAVDNWEQPRFRVQTGRLADWLGTKLGCRQISARSKVNIAR
ncbi:hypothetical protein HYFRA_00010786 [Hymenoscyphus fraxineus]|uniref:Uncharacterized protein n=1 Tax=Hymenoscyphus fraxineus TaxID=746836 RepID=A0A9N9L431_9HELO|nr:hypothetical protein HYFRA_00010786 [Hymenoscyphus fraxineus]